MNFIKDKNVRNAIFIGLMCSASYLAVYFAKNILSAVSPQMIENGVVSQSNIGAFSSTYFTIYAIGQLINGSIGDKIKARYMISFGLIFAGVCTFIFSNLVETPFAAQFAYGIIGFFLSMIYGPMTKVVAENTDPLYAPRCSLGYTFASFFGSPLAGVAASLLIWKAAFTISGSILIFMGAVCFGVFLILEKKEIIKYNKYSKKAEVNNSRAGFFEKVRVLIKRRILTFTMISIITGVVRTAVVFWLPVYMSQYLGFTSEHSAAIFTIVTFVFSATVFVALFIYEKMKRDKERTILVMFSAALCFFVLVYFVKQPVLNIILLVLAVLSSNCASSILWSIYCPGLRDTGMVSTATGFLDFVSYMAASAASTIFANAVSAIGWGNLILVWTALMALGVAISVPGVYKKQIEN